MDFTDVHFRAATLAKMSGMYLLLPEGPGPFPVLYLLHGLSDNHTGWLRRTSIERYMDKVPMIVVMPDGHRSFYVNDSRPGGNPYEDHIVKDVIGFVDRAFHTIPDRRARAVAGLSMGGYGAMMLALRHPDVFSVACSHSGALAAFHTPRKELPLLQELAAGVPAGKYDCFALAMKLKGPRAKGTRGKAPAGKRAAGDLAIRFDCGDTDFLLEDSRAFHAHLDLLGIEHTYEEFPGDHNWGYWDVHIQDTVRFIQANLPAWRAKG
jgi:putative tributyrin esterase